jgi:SAM-dependent methyltransferase
VNSKYNLEPYGVDFTADSIEQARKEVPAEFAENFVVANIVDYNLRPESFNFILLDPSSIHKDDLNHFLKKVLKACRPHGKVLFCTYRDVIKVLHVLSIAVKILPPLKERLPWKFERIVKSVTDLLPENLRSCADKTNHRHVSIGVYNCRQHCYFSTIKMFSWRARRDLNPEPLAPETGSLILQIYQTITLRQVS